MKKAIALLLCLVLALPLGVSADTNQVTLSVNDAAFVLDILHNGLQLTAAHAPGVVAATMTEDGKLLFTVDDEVHAMPELLDSMSVSEQAAARAVNGIVEYLAEEENREELSTLFSMVLERIPALNQYLGWQQKEGGVLEMKHSLSSLLTVLSHFFVNELVDTGMIGYLNQSALNAVWQFCAKELRLGYMYSQIPLGFAAYLYLTRMPMEFYSSYLPEEPVTIRLYRNEEGQLQKIEAAFSMTEDGMHLDAQATLASYGLDASLCITYDKEPGVENTATLRVDWQDDQCEADFALCFPSEDESAHLWGTAAYAENGPDVLLLCDLPGEWMNLSFRLTGNKLYLTSLATRGSGGFSLFCDWTEEDYNIDFSCDDRSYNVKGAYALNETPASKSNISYSKTYSVTFAVRENDVLLLEGSYNANYDRKAVREKMENSNVTIISYKQNLQHALEGTVYNTAAAAAQSGTEEKVSVSPLVRLLSDLSGEKVYGAKMSSEYDFCLQYTYANE